MNRLHGASSGGADHPVDGNHESVQTTDQETGARHPWRRALVSLVVLSVAATGVVVAVTNQVAEAGQASVLASDSFARTQSNGWGKAPSGGGWTTTGAVKGSFSVSSGTGIIRLATNGRAPTALLKSVSSARTDLRMSLRTNVVPKGKGVEVFAIGRRIEGTHQYVTGVRLLPGGSVSVQLGRRSASGKLAVLKSVAKMPHLSYAAGQVLQVRLQVFGTNPTTLRTKVWSAKSAEPAAWTLTTTDKSKAYQSKGAVGVSGYLNSNGPVVLRIDNFVATAMAMSGAAPSVGSAGAHLSSRASRGAGSVTVGRARYAVPRGAIFVAPGGRDTLNGSLHKPVRTVARAMAMAHNGGTIVLRGGIYHQSITMAKGKKLTIQSYPGEAVWFDGSSAVSGWTRSGSVWVKSGWTAKFDHSPTYSAGAPDSTSANWSFVNAAHPMAAYPDQVWINGSALNQVGSLSQVKRGSFYVDYGSQKLYIGSDPTGRAVRATDLTTAITVLSPGSIVRGFGVRNYGTSVYMMGTVRVFAPWVTLENLVVSDNATQGVAMDAIHGTLRHVSALRNGLLGIHGNYADGLRAISVLAAGNNTQHFNHSPVSGGMKITRSRNISVVNSVFKSNDGHGLWFDESVYGAKVIGNDIVSNNGNGFVSELGDTMTIVNNVFRNNVQNGIKLDNTGHVQVVNNSFFNNNRNVNITQDPRSQFKLSDAGHDPRQKLPDKTVPWLSAYVTVSSNVFTNSTGNALLAVEDYTHRYSASDLHTVASGNVYIRSVANRPNFLIIWSRGAGSPATFATVAQFRAATGQSG